MQPMRSLLASMDILLATIISNAIVLLSLLRDRGYKKTKYKHGTAQAGFHTKGTVGIGGNRRRGGESPPTTKWGSDENLVSNHDAYGDKKGAMISMEVLRSDKRSRSSGERTSVEETGLDAPPKAKLQDIRIATTWEVSVESNGRKE